MVLDRSKDIMKEDVEKIEGVGLEEKAIPQYVSGPVVESAVSCEDRSECFSSTFQECLFVLTITVAVNWSQVLAGALLCMVNTMGDDLHMTVAQVTWINAAQSLTNGAFLLFFGRVADLFGRRILILLGMISTTVCLIGTGFVTHGILMDTCLGLIGFFSAAAVPAAIGKLGAVYKQPSKRKNRAFACCSAGTAIGSILGAIIGGVALEISTWRACFWCLAGICAVCTILAFWTIPIDAEHQLVGSKWKVMRQFDVVGAFLAVTGIGSLVTSLTVVAQAPDGWRTPYVLGLLVSGICLLALFLYWQSLFTYPLMPLSIWRDRNFSLMVAILSLCFFGFVGSMMWLCLIWQRIEGNSGLLVAAKLLPAGLGGLSVNVILALTMHRINNKTLIIVGTLAFVGFNVLLSANSKHVSYWALSFPALILSTIGADFLFTVTNVYVSSSLPIDQQSLGAGILVTISRIASTIGVGVQTSVFAANGGSNSGNGAIEYHAYQTTFWVSLAGSVIALVLLPFVTLGLQGVESQIVRRASETSIPSEDRNSGK